MEALNRAALLAEARAWIGTPYQHQASVRGVGCDCLGLIRGVWRQVVGPEPQSVPPYAADWAIRGEPEILLQAARRWLREVPLNSVAAGDVALFRMSADAPAKHCGIITASNSIIHAYWGRAVVESRLAPWWIARLAYAFQFPGVDIWRN